MDRILCYRFATVHGRGCARCTSCFHCHAFISFSCFHCRASVRDTACKLWDTLIWKMHVFFWHKPPAKSRTLLPVPGNLWWSFLIFNPDLGVLLHNEAVYSKANKLFKQWFAAVLLPPAFALKHFSPILCMQYQTPPSICFWTNKRFGYIYALVQIICIFV